MSTYNKVYNFTNAINNMLIEDENVFINYE